MAKQLSLLTSSLVWALVMVLNDQVTEAAHLQPYMETNEIVADPKPQPPLPVCRPNAVCGYLQANARGINVERLCSCHRGSCPLQWDPLDGHSVTQGSDQYKTCDPAPQNLKVCDPRETAYTSRILFNKVTEVVLAKTDHIKCICPETSNYDMANQHFEEVDGEVEQMDFTYVCSPLPLCKGTEACKTISEKEQSFLINRKCICPMDETCPTQSEDQTKSIPFGAGHYSLIQCKAPRF